MSMGGSEGTGEVVCVATSCVVGGSAGLREGKLLLASKKKR